MSTEHGIGDPFAAAIRGSRMPIIFADPHQPDTPIIFANDAYCRMTGYELDEVAGKNCRFMQGPDTAPESVRLIDEAIATRTPIGIDILNYRKDGTPYWNALYISPVFNEAGDLLCYFSSQFDATERRRHAQAILDRKEELEGEVEASTRDLKKALASLERALEEKTLLIHEVDHRVKNILQTIATLIGLQIRGLDDPVAIRALQSLHERVDALGAVHRRLNTNQAVGEFDLSDLVRELVPEIVKGAACGDIGVDIDVPSVKLHVSKATPISLILNELVTNSVRHAWDAGEAGNLKVCAHAEYGHVMLTVSDDGKGTPITTSSRSLSGLKLTEALVRQVRGTMARRHTVTGTSLEIGFSVS